MAFHDLWLGDCRRRYPPADGFGQKASDSKALDTALVVQYRVVWRSTPILTEIHGGCWSFQWSCAKMRIAPHLFGCLPDQGIHKTWYTLR